MEFLHDKRVVFACVGKYVVFGEAMYGIFFYQVTSQDSIKLRVSGIPTKLLCTLNLNNCLRADSRQSLKVSNISVNYICKTINYYLISDIL